MASASSRATVAYDLGLVPSIPAAEAVELAAEAERLGFDGVWVADSQSIFRDGFAILALCATRTRRLLLTTGVTNPVTRHPAVVAGAFATLEELAPGRIVLAIGRGESAVRTAGLRPATLARMKEAVLALRALLAGETVSWDGAKIRMAWPVRPIPIYVTASGPRALRLAGQVGDGVLFQVGADRDLIRWALGHIAEGARESGRSLADLTTCVRLGCSVDPDRGRARAAITPYASAAANTIFCAVPPDQLPPHLVEDVRGLRERYDYYEHALEGARHEELLTDPVLDAVAVAGTPEEVLPRLRAIGELGVDRIVLTFSTSDASAIVHTLGERVLPAIR